MNRSAGLAARRVRQTVTGFSNGPQVLLDLASARTPWGRRELHFRTRDGVSIRCPNVAGARVPVYEVFVEDAYRVAELLDGLPPDPVVLDIGAQVGCFSVALATAAPRATVHSFEASPTTARWLRRNVDDNGLAGRVHPRHQALADHDGTMRFADNGGGSGQNGLTSPEDPGVVEVPCTTFAGAVALAGGRVDLVKIDIEGGEYDVVLPSRPSDWAGVRRLVMEYHPVPGRSWAELERFLNGLGFVVDRHESVEEGIGAVWLSRTPTAP